MGVQPLISWLCAAREERRASRGAPPPPTHPPGAAAVNQPQLPAPRPQMGCVGSKPKKADAAPTLEGDDRAMGELMI